MIYDICSSARYTIPGKCLLSACREIDNPISCPLCFTRHKPRQASSRRTYPHMHFSTQAETTMAAENNEIRNWHRENTLYQRTEKSLTYSRSSCPRSRHPNISTNQLAMHLLACGLQACIVAILGPGSDSVHARDLIWGWSVPLSRTGTWHLAATTACVHLASHAVASNGSGGPGACFTLIL